MDEAANPWRVLPADAVLDEWRAADGFALRRLTWAPEGASRGALLFAGGRGDFIEKYLEAYAWWRAKGWAVTAFDWRGQGRSRGQIRLGNYVTFNGLVDDLAALIADWRAASPDGPHVAIGHSMGGHLLLRTLIDKAPPLDAAVLVAPMLGVNSYPMPAWLAPQIAELMCLAGWRDETVWKRDLAHSRPGGVRNRNLTSSAERYADELFWWEGEPEMNVGPPSWGWLRAAYRSAAKTFTPRKLAKVTMPILILATERDRLVSDDAIRDAAAALPNVRVEWVNEAAHEILREVDPIRLDALGRIDAFLAGIGR
ncbi:alpha/beta fold hydrolase [Sphingosinicella sp.]|uniref:alpha/beta fold hydrolase n=1 Tax=Sphingosinicella sp. TaxID=1917971 RepID=UPI0040378C28